MKEEITITTTVNRYRDSQGRKTCAASFKTGDVCSFLGCKRFGTLEYCGYDTFKEVRLFRRDTKRWAGLGTLIPHDGCKLWKEAKP